MKKRILLTLGVFCSLYAISQQAPTPAVPADPTSSLPNTQKGAYAWYRGGNTPVSNPAGTSNMFGTLWNSPIYTVTNGVNRTRLNGTLTNNYLGTGFLHDVSGHFGIGLNNYFATNTPLTMLHLEGLNNTPFDGGQFRGWMRTGMFARENSDAMYVGMKPEGPNRSDAVVSWSDDNVGGGPDYMRFLFTTTLSNLPGAVDPLIGNSQNGYEFMRMHASGPINEAATNAGYIGIGPLFTLFKLLIHLTGQFDDFRTNNG